MHRKLPLTLTLLLLDPENRRLSYPATRKRRSERGARLVRVPSRACAPVEPGGRFEDRTSLGGGGPAPAAGASLGRVRSSARKAASSTRRPCSFLVALLRDVWPGARRPQALGPGRPRRGRYRPSGGAAAGAEQGAARRVTGLPRGSFGAGFGRRRSGGSGGALVHLPRCPCHPARRA